MDSFWFCFLCFFLLYFCFIFTPGFYDDLRPVDVVIVEQSTSRSPKRKIIQETECSGSPVKSLRSAGEAICEGLTYVEFEEEDFEEDSDGSSWKESDEEDEFMGED